MLVSLTLQVVPLPVHEILLRIACGQEYTTFYPVSVCLDCTAKQLYTSGHLDTFAPDFQASCARG